MLYFDRIDVSEGIDIYKTNASKECGICHYRCFLDKEVKFQSHVCNCCHDVLMMSMNLSDIAILNINVADYRCIINGIIKTEVINPMLKVDLNEKKGTLQSIIFFLSCIKDR